MINSIFQINFRKTVFSAHNKLLKKGFLVLTLLLSATANYADNVDFNTALRIARTYVSISNVLQQRQHNSLTTSSMMIRAKDL